MIEEIRDQVARRKISRLCHFTPSHNLVHIAVDPKGILATDKLGEEVTSVLNQTDELRLDGYLNHVCCSIQYPNAWYFRKARGKERLFVDWVVLFIAPRYLWLAGTKFCPRNAAAGYGKFVKEGLEGFEQMFRDEVAGAGGYTFTRSATHPLWLPTDQQAEVLIPDKVEREDIIGIAVADEAQAKREKVRLETLGAPIPRIVIAPDFFTPRQLSRTLSSGETPEEREFYAGDKDD